MATAFQNFLQVAQARILPNQTAQQTIKTLLDTLVPVVILNTQADRVQRGTLTHTMVGGTRPRFTLAECPIDEIHRYDFIGIRRQGGSGTPDYTLEVVYPAMTDAMTELFEVPEQHNLNVLSIIPGTNGLNQRCGRPLYVYPQGVLQFTKASNSTIGFTYHFMFLRTILGGPNDSHVVQGQISSAEV